MKSMIISDRWSECTFSSHSILFQHFLSPSLSLLMWSGVRLSASERGENLMNRRNKIKIHIQRWREKERDNFAVNYVQSEDQLWLIANRSRIVENWIQDKKREKKRRKCLAIRIRFWLLFCTMYVNRRHCGHRDWSFEVLGVDNNR